jgi:hypothetical protein
MRIVIKQHKKLNDYFHAFNSDNIQYYESLKYFLLKTKKVKGDILEFGIGRGRSMIATLHIMSEYNINKKIFAFDSFDGFGKISDEDKSYRNPKKREWAFSPKKQFKYNIKNIKKILSYHLYKKKIKKIKFIKGFVEDTLKKQKFNSISFINLDLDLYNGHKIVLEKTFEKLSKYGIIYLDDIILKSKKKAPFPGAYTAVKEYFKNKKNIKKYYCKLRRCLVIQKI